MVVHTSGHGSMSNRTTLAAKTSKCLKNLQLHAKTIELTIDFTLALLVFAALVQGIAALRSVFSVKWDITLMAIELSSCYTFETFLATFSDCLSGGSALNPVHLSLVQGAVVMLALVCLLELLIVRVR